MPIGDAMRQGGDHVGQILVPPSVSSCSNKFAVGVADVANLTIDRPDKWLIELRSALPLWLSLWDRRLAVGSG